ncbi:MAG: hypothetical protein AAF413_04825 [Patescibacteria group bacterium]
MIRERLNTEPIAQARDCDARRAAHLFSSFFGRELPFFIIRNTGVKNPSAIQDQIVSELLDAGLCGSASARVKYMHTRCSRPGRLNKRDAAKGVQSARVRSTTAGRSRGSSLSPMHQDALEAGKPLRGQVRSAITARKGIRIVKLLTPLPGVRLDRSNWFMKPAENNLALFNAGQVPAGLFEPAVSTAQLYPGDTLFLDNYVMHGFQAIGGVRDTATSGTILLDCDFT